MNSTYFAEPGSPATKYFRRIPFLKQFVNKWSPPDFIRTPYNTSFVESKKFSRAYQSAVEAGGFDYRIPWRVHQAIWASQHALHLESDFVELGTGKGFMMAAVLSYIGDWDNIDKQLWLYDMFQLSTVSGKGKIEHNRYYAESIDDVKNTFNNYNNVKFIQGDVMNTVVHQDISPDKIAFLHVDLNDAKSEVYSLEHLWSKVSKGAVILLDDYANRGHENQYLAMNELFTDLGRYVLTTPSGQGIVIK